ncbi:MAG: transposase [Verrucomicrobiota bacterium]
MDASPHPVAGKDYPRTYQEFLEWFGSEHACRRYLARCRWPDGLRCARCDVLGAAWVTGRSEDAAAPGRKSWS